jgi:hypothetical protein
MMSGLLGDTKSILEALIRCALRPDGPTSLPTTLPSHPRGSTRETGTKPGTLQEDPCDRYPDEGPTSWSSLADSDTVGAKRPTARASALEPINGALQQSCGPTTITAFACWHLRLAHDRVEHIRDDLANVRTFHAVP